MSTRNEIYEYLVFKSQEVGLALVTQACKEFLKAGSRVGVVPTKRKRIPRSWVLEALDRQNGLCSICKEPLHINEAVGDHVIPLAGSGKHSKWNIGASHRACNASKGTRMPMEQAKKTQRLLTDVI